MLSNEPWITLGRDIYLEFEQDCLDGLDVEKYRKICEGYRSLDRAELAALENGLEELERAMQNSARVSGYDEPSDYGAIKAAAPGAARSAAPEGEALKNRLRGAWLGRMAGCLLGKPVESVMREPLEDGLKSSGNFPLSRYMALSDFPAEVAAKYGFDRRDFWIDTVHGISPADDDTNYTVLALKIVENYGKDFTAEDVLHGWLRWLPYLSTCTAERVAYRNAAAGLLPPETVSYKNPYREWIGAQIRADFYGYINPGDPEKAAEMAFRDASATHVKNGIYGAMFVAAMLAEAAVTDDVMTVIRAGLSVIPEKCRLRDDIERVIAWHAEGLDAGAITDRIHSVYDERSQTGWCYTNPNAMIVTMALVTGGGDFGKSICTAVQAAFDTDCNGATVGSVVGMLAGAGGIPDKWISPFGGRLKTAIAGYGEVTAEGLAEKTAEIISN